MPHAINLKSVKIKGNGNLDKHVPDSNPKSIMAFKSY